MMLNLDAERAANEPWWFTVHEAVGNPDEEGYRPPVRVRFLPIGRIALRAARRAAADQYLAANLPDDEDAPIPPDLIERAGDALSECLLMAGIEAWEGIGDRDGNIAPVTTDNVSLFLADPLRFEKLDRAYVRPFVERELEKNALPGSPIGTSVSAGERTAAKSASRTKRAVVRRTKNKN